MKPRPREVPSRETTIRVGFKTLELAQNFMSLLKEPSRYEIMKIVDKELSGPVIAYIVENKFYL